MMTRYLHHKDMLAFLSPGQLITPVRAIARFEQNYYHLINLLLLEAYPGPWDENISTENCNHSKSQRV